MSSPPSYDQINEPPPPPPPYSSLRLVSLSSTPVQRRTDEQQQFNEKFRRTRMIFIFNLCVGLACVGLFLSQRELFCSNSKTKSICHLLIVVVVFAGVLVFISLLFLAYRYALMKGYRKKTFPAIVQYHHQT